VPTLRAVAIMILAIFLASALCVPASASEVAVTVQGEQVHATFDLSLVQNVTRLPGMTATVDSTAQSDVSSAFNAAVSKPDPSASASAVNIEISSTAQRLNLTCQADISGVSNRRGDILAVNMSWLGFNVSSDLRVENFSFNTVGNRYMKPVVAYYANASRFLGRPNVNVTGVTFFVNKTSIAPAPAVDYIGNFTMLDFRSLSPTLDEWNRTYSLTNNTTSWRYSPSTSLNFDMKIERGNITTDFTASYGYNATISVSAVGRQEGHILLLDVGTSGIEWVMTTILILAVVSALGIQLMFRNRKKRTAKFQRR